MISRYFSYRWDATAECRIKIDALKLLDRQLEGMNDPDDMKACVRGSIRYYEDVMSDMKKLMEEEMLEKVKESKNDITEVEE